jgi:hypothetical protein
MKPHAHAVMPSAIVPVDDCGAPGSRSSHDETIDAARRGARLHPRRALRSHPFPHPDKGNGS